MRSTEWKISDKIAHRPDERKLVPGARSSLSSPLSPKYHTSFTHNVRAKQPSYNSILRPAATSIDTELVSLCSSNLRRIRVLWAVPVLLG